MIRAFADRIAAQPMLPLAVTPVLASCALFSPSTTISVQVARQNGETISAEYHSTKDIAAPSFVFERNPDTGQVEASRSRPKAPALAR